MKIYEESFIDRNYRGDHKKMRSDIMFMNGKSNSRTGSPMQGMVSQVNIWDNILSSEKLEDLASCRNIINGNVVSWENSLLRIHRLDISQINISELCPHQKLVHISFPMRKNLENTITFCKKIGGNIAVANNEVALAAMVNAYDISVPFLEEHENFREGFKIKKSMEG